MHHPCAGEPQEKHTPRLDGSLVCYRCNVLWLVVLSADCPRLPWWNSQPLQVDWVAILLSLALLRGVGLNTGKELLSGARVTDVLDADVDALLDVAVADLSVEDDADCGLGHIVDDTSLAVVDFVWLDVSQRCSTKWAATAVFGKSRARSIHTMPFWTAPFATTSTISPTLYCLRYVPKGIIPFFLKSREKAVPNVSLVFHNPFTSKLQFRISRLSFGISARECTDHSECQRGDLRRDPL